jgi:hypothetical protein
VSRENAPLGRIDSIEMRAHGTEPSFRLCLTGYFKLFHVLPQLDHAVLALDGEEPVRADVAKMTTWASFILRGLSLTPPPRRSSIATCGLGAI